jgi:hypothetical protein
LKYLRERERERERETIVEIRFTDDQFEIKQGRLGIKEVIRIINMSIKDLKKINSERFDAEKRIEENIIQQVNEELTTEVKADFD